MATPNQGPAPNLNPGNDIDTLPTHDVDLSNPAFQSDGQSQQPQVTELAGFLNYLTRMFKHRPHYATTLGYSAIFINALPQGYVLERRARAENTSSRSYARQRVNYDDYIHGHPSGRPYRSVRDFARHVYHIMRDDLANCDCSLC